MWALLLGLRVLSTSFAGLIIAETDCAFLANELQSGIDNHSGVFLVVYDIKKEFGKFQSVLVTHTSRKQNSLAHCLAARARTMEEVQVTTGVPEDLKEVMTVDYVLAPE